MRSRRRGSIKLLVGRSDVPILYESSINFDPYLSFGLVKHLLCVDGGFKEGLLLLELLHMALCVWQSQLARLTCYFSIATSLCGKTILRLFEQH